jgi:hypothetical protein
MQFVHAFFFALVTNVNTIYCSHNLCWLPPNLTFVTRENIKLIVLSPTSQIPLPRQLWLGQVWQFARDWCADFTWSYAMDSLRVFLLHGIPFVPTDPDALYLYMRGGATIWKSSLSLNRNYAQPPCRFYTDAMRGFKVVLVIGDKWNPCIEVAIRAGAYWHPYKDRNDMGRMVYSHAIALAHSSRSHAILALSPFKKRFWLYDQAKSRRQEPFWWHGFVPTDFGNGTNCVPSDEVKDAFLIWNASKSQKALIKTASCFWEPIQ